MMQKIFLVDRFAEHHTERDRNVLGSVVTGVNKTGC